MRKPVLGVSVQAILKPICSATEVSQSLDILDVASIGIMHQSFVIAVLLTFQFLKPC